MNRFQNHTNKTKSRPKLKSRLMRRKINKYSKS